MNHKGLSFRSLIVCSVLAVAMLFLSPDFSQLALRTSDGFAFASHGGGTIPDTFTIRYDTAEGIQFMVHARGGDYIRVTSPTALETGKENCVFFGRLRLGITREQSHFTGIISFDPTTPAREPVWECFFDRDYSKDFVERFCALADNRILIRYVADRREVTCGRRDAEQTVS